ncbi:IclR family transcriptional regulator [Sphingobium olei]|uniref:IclR family transcriptional regulator n=1 Tax=Sphingobium olei TaxID=420955 RepID=A0ABW3NZ08_9SPHN
MKDSAQSASVKSATRTLDIIELVVSRNTPIVAQDIATALGIPVSSLSYLLGTLVDRGYLAREGRYYRPGPGLERLQAPQPAFTLAERVAPLVRTLRVQLDETASFFVQRGWELEALVTESSQQALRYAVQIGSSAPLHAVAAGKAILAAMDDDQLDLYFISTQREVFTLTTISTEPELREEIAEIRRSGIARTHEEYTPGIRGLGRAVTIGGKVVGAFGIAMPLVRADAELERRATSLLLRTAELLEDDRPLA